MSKSMYDNDLDFQLDYFNGEMIERVLEKMESLNVSKDELCEQLGWSRKYFNAVFNEDIPLSIKTLIEIVIKLDQQLTLILKNNDL